MMVPNARPKRSKSEVLELLRAHGVEAPVALVGVRGYYLRTMGDPAKNDRGLYDDAIFLVGEGVFAAFNANTDPSRGHTTGLASLEPGVWEFAPGTHNRSKAKRFQYPALIQAASFVLRRDGTEEHKEGENHPRYGRCLGGGRWQGWFGINLHRGGHTTTSSLGCQTIPPAQWDEFLALVKREMERHGMQRIPYLLTEEPAPLPAQPVRVPDPLPGTR